MVSKRGLLIMSGLLWSIAGFNVLRKGLLSLAQDHRWWILLLAIAIGAAFLLMFRGVVRKYSQRIFSLPGERHAAYLFMSRKGYLLIGVMMGLGIAMSHVPGMPLAFFASFYTGLGTGLTYGAIRFFTSICKSIN